jgi:hypothetical protein
MVGTSCNWTQIPELLFNLMQTQKVVNCGRQRHQNGQTTNETGQAEREGQHARLLSRLTPLIRKPILKMEAMALAEFCKFWRGAGQIWQMLRPMSHKLTEKNMLSSPLLKHVQT